MTTFIQKIGLIFLGVLLAAFILELGLRLAGWSLVLIQDLGNTAEMHRFSAYRIMCIGESTTSGEYPPFLREALRVKCPGIKISVVDKGVSGTNTDYILENLEHNLSVIRPDMVVAMIGVNDAGKYLPEILPPHTKPKSVFQYLKIYKLYQLMGMHLRKKFSEWSGQLHTSNDTALRVGALYEQGRRYKAQGNIKEAARSFEKAMSIDPLDARSFFQWLWVSHNQNSKVLIRNFADRLRASLHSPERDDRLVKNVLRLASELSEWGAAYRDMDLAEDLTREIMRVDDHEPRAYFILGQCLEGKGRFPDAEIMYKRSLAMNPEDFKVVSVLANFYRERHRLDLAAQYEQLKKKIARVYYSEKTVRNYRRIKEILDSKGVCLVAVQYALRPSEPLKHILDFGKPVILVDNDLLFRKAVDEYGFRKVFRDAFAGDFGHCTKVGNKLLGDNIADAIIKNVIEK